MRWLEQSPIHDALELQIAGFPASPVRPLTGGRRFRHVLKSREMRAGRPPLCGALLAAAIALPSPAGADSAGPPPGPPPPPVDGCATWDVEYTVAANVQLSDTMMGAGDGVHTIGPGRIVLRIENADSPAPHVRMRVYDMKDGFTVVAKALFWGTKVTNNTRTSATPDDAGTIAEGTLDGTTLRWTTVVRAMHTDGTLLCEGSLCGKFGAPPEGASEVHTAPHPVTFNPFTFDAEKRTFTMPYAVVSRSENPKQTSKVTLAGREVKRWCAAR